MPDRALTIRDVCERLGVCDDVVHAWIRRGELRAVNVSRKLGGRPTWRVVPEALAAFESLRTPKPPAPRARRKRKEHSDPGYIHYYTREAGR